MRRWAPVAGVLALVLLAGCAQSVDPIERLGEKATRRAGSHGSSGAGSPRTAAGAWRAHCRPPRGHPPGPPPRSPRARA